MISKLTNRILGSVVWSAAAVCVVGAFAVGAVAQVTSVETFESGTNPSAWTWGTGSEDIVENDGNPGRYLRENYLVTFTPRAST
ncbi:MAG TPA: hypothetical protein VFZ49_03490, partial [Pyrinomonadaceae bacterium]